jgi:hypothetical protein
MRLLVTGAPAGLRMRGVTTKTRAELKCAPLQLQGRRRNSRLSLSPMAMDMINHTCVIKLP